MNTNYHPKYHKKKNPIEHDDFFFRRYQGKGNHLKICNNKSQLQSQLKNKFRSFCQVYIFLCDNNSIFSTCDYLNLFEATTKLTNFYCSFECQRRAMNSMRVTVSLFTGIFAIWIWRTVI